MILSGDVELNPGPGDVERKRSSHSKMSVSVNKDSNVKNVEQKKAKRIKKSVHFEVIILLFFRIFSLKYSYFFFWCKI